MKIAIDISPLKTGHFLKHRVRGTGFYLQNLKDNLRAYAPQHEYLAFQRGGRLPCDIDVIHYPYFEPFFLTLPLKKRFKSVVTVHDLTPLVFPFFFPPGLKGSIKWQIQKRSLKQMDAIITDSESSKRDILRYVGVPKEIVHVIYLAAGEEFGKVNELHVNELKRKYNLPKEFVLYVGDATWNKNLPRLIRAIKKINVPLVMAGKALLDKHIDVHNPWNKDLVEVQKLAENDNLMLRLGFIPNEDLVLLYNAATVFVMPSLYEGFGLPILEAMACGCPVVTSKEGSIPEVAGDAAFFVDSYDIDNIAAGIEEVFLSASLQKTLSAKGLEYCRKFSWKKTVLHTIAVYKSVGEIDG